MNERDVEFENHRGLTLRGVVHEADRPKAVIILVHGLLGSAFGETSPAIARAAYALGYTTLRFDLSCTNTSDGRLEDKRMSEEALDIGDATAFIGSLELGVPIIVHGHSTGAIDAGLWAHRDELISGLILNAPVSDLRHAVHYDFDAEQIREFETSGRLSLSAEKKAWYAGEWFEGKALGKGFYDEFFELDLPAAIRAYHKPLLIVHGSADEAIPVSKDPHELYALANEPKELAIIEGADHRYTTPGTFETLIATIDSWIERVVLGGSR